MGRDTARRVIPLFRPYRGRVTVVVGLIVLTSTIGIVNPLLIQAVFNKALFVPGGPNLELLYILVGVMAVVPIVNGAIGILQTYETTMVGQHVMRDLRDLVAPDWIDHDPLPGQPAGLDGAEYVVTTMHGAHPDLRFTIDDLIAEADRVTIRWTLHGTNTGPMLGRPPTGQPVELAAIVIFRIADGKIAERWAGWKPGRAPVR